MLIDDLRNNIKISLKEKIETRNSINYSVYKNILDKAQKDAKENKCDVIADEYIIRAARKELKQLEDTLSYITNESDPKRFSELTESIAVVNNFLPKSVSKQEIAEYLLDSHIEKNMKSLKLKFGALLDNKIASEVVKEYIK